jgi:hypothetical protein
VAEPHRQGGEHVVAARAVALREIGKCPSDAEYPVGAPGGQPATGQVSLQHWQRRWVGRPTPAQFVARHVGVERPRQSGKASCLAVPRRTDPYGDDLGRLDQLLVGAQLGARDRLDELQQVDPVLDRPGKPVLATGARSAEGCVR